MTTENGRDEFIKVLKEAYTSLLILTEDIKYPLSEDRQKWLDGATLLIRHLYEKEMEADQEYFQAYIDVNGIKDGDEVMFHEYASWITDKHSEFRRMKGCPYCNGYPPDVQAEFDAFIRLTARE